jgi:hypothetical protein
MDICAVVSALRMTLIHLHTSQMARTRSGCLESRAGISDSVFTDHQATHKHRYRELTLNTSIGGERSLRSV